MLLNLTPSLTHAAPATTPSPAQNPTLEQQLCPQPIRLVRNQKTLKWSVPHSNWRSDAMSFVSQIDRFVGAQWTGANIGQITCIYIGKQKQSFPVLLRYQVLAIEPSGHYWGKNVQGFRNCAQPPNAAHTITIYDCPFYVRKRPPQKNIYDIVNQLKGSDNLDNFDDLSRY